MTEQERREAELQLSKLDKQVIGAVGGSLVGVALLAGAAGYDLGYRAKEKETAPAVTHIHGNQIINNSININSSDAGDTGE
jgi:hypothetical protein